MSTLLIALLVLVVLIALGVLGAVIEGLLWLALIGAVVVLAAAAYGWIRLRNTTNRWRGSPQ